MRAAMYQAYGPPEVLTLVDRPTPLPRGDQVQVRVHATTVTSAECGMRRGEPRWGRVIIGPLRPRKGIRVLGLEFAGEVCALGPAARRFGLGERVFGFTGFAAGANAEYTCLSEGASLTTMPPNVSVGAYVGKGPGVHLTPHDMRNRVRLHTASFMPSGSAETTGGC